MEVLSSIILEPFSCIKIKQPNIYELDHLDSALSFIPKYMVGMILTGRAEHAFTTLQATLTNRPSLYVCLCPLISLSEEFFSIHNYVSKLFFKGEINFDSILLALKIYVYTVINDDCDVHNAMLQLQYTSVTDLVEMVEDLISPISAMALITPVKSRISQLSIYNLSVTEANTGRHYYPLLPCDLFWEVGFKLHTWDFLGKRPWLVRV